jgi:hypothetical protein
MGATAALRESEFDEIVVRVENEKQGGVSPALHNSCRLRASVYQHTKTPHPRVCPMFGLHLVAVSVHPSQVFYSELFCVLAREETIAPKDGIAVP